MKGTVKLQFGRMRERERERERERKTVLPVKP
jgi:hypothetical protein